MSAHPANDNQPPAGKPQSASSQGSAPRPTHFDDGAGVGHGPALPPERVHKSGQAQAGSVVDRRSGLDRRDFESPFDTKDFDRRRGPGRRLSDSLRAAEEGELTKEQFLFLMAVEAFKKGNGRAFPSWTDVLEVVRLLGYRKTMPMTIRLSAAEDWQEPANAPCNVRPPRWAEHAKPPKNSREAA